MTSKYPMLLLFLLFALVLVLSVGFASGVCTIQIHQATNTQPAALPIEAPPDIGNGHSASQMDVTTFTCNYENLTTLAYGENERLLGGFALLSTSNPKNTCAEIAQYSGNGGAAANPAVGKRIANTL